MNVQLATSASMRKVMPAVGLTPNHKINSNKPHFDPSQSFVRSKFGPFSSPLNAFALYKEPAKLPPSSSFVC